MEFTRAKWDWTLGPFFFLAITVLVSQGVMVTKQRSTYNGDMSWYGMDGNDKSCAITGYDFRPWWKVDFGQERTVGSVTVLGRLQYEDPPNIRIRVGKSTGLGHDDAHLRNDICAAWRGGPVILSEGLTFLCKRNITGSHLTIESKGVNGSYVQLVICEVSLTFL